MTYIKSNLALVIAALLIADLSFAALGDQISPSDSTPNLQNRQKIRLETKNGNGDSNGNGDGDGGNDDTRNKYQVYVTSRTSNLLETTRPPEIREYATAAGLVFGVTWSGTTHPDLQTLLGSYTQEYHDTEARIQERQANPETFVRPSSRSRKRVQTPNLIVEFSGHMRNVHGRAYIPYLMPGGLNPSDVK